MESTGRPFWRHCDTTPQDRRNQRRVLLWMSAWTVSWLGVNAGIKFDWLSPGAPAIGAAVLSTALGVGWVLAYRRFLRDADELRRKIELDALALAVGVGVVGAVAYWLLEMAGAVAETDLLNIAVLMIFTHTAGVLLGRRRYA